jgi:hypothetical protein
VSAPRYRSLVSKNKHDGATHKPFYAPPILRGPEPPAEIENSKLYTGSCHCGAVRMALKNRGPLIQEAAPVAEEIGPEVIGECDCSICARVSQPKLQSHILINLLIRALENSWAESSPIVHQPKSLYASLPAPISAATLPA